MPYFLTAPEIYRVLQRELPDNVYADGAPSGAFTTADNYSFASVVADAYANLRRVYVNKFPQYADENIDDWETMVFGRLSPATLTLAQRRTKLVRFLRTRPSLSNAGMKRAVLATVVELSDGDVEIIAWGCAEGGWVLDVSELDTQTILRGSNQVNATGAGLCDASPSDFGLTPEEWAVAQQEAYTYEVIISNYTLSADQTAAIDATLTAAEKAGSTHVITNL